jgi:tetratricopeptide (TPR) repeat protein
LFKRSLENQESPEVAFELASMLASEKFLTESLEIFNRAIDLSSSPAPANYYIHRAAVYEALGLVQLAKTDYMMIDKADPNLRTKYMNQQATLTAQGRHKETFQIQMFLDKMNDSLMK